MEFLEFLGEWETDEGEWVDPEYLDNEAIGKLIEVMKETNNEQ
tara:strand:- start:4093 stop:4221 length:129 start_codon:yes stop_codon:yes gene_type:complete